MELSAAVSLSLPLLLSLSTSIPVSSGENARLAGVVFVEELGGSIFLRFGVVGPRSGCSSGWSQVFLHIVGSVVYKQS
jgi:hypothetical protein